MKSKLHWIANNLIEKNPFLKSHIDEVKRDDVSNTETLSFHFKDSTMRSTLCELVEEIKEYGYFNKVDMWWHEDLNGNGRVYATKYTENHWRNRPETESEKLYNYGGCRL